MHGLNERYKLVGWVKKAIEAEIAARKHTQPAKAPAPQPTPQPTAVGVMASETQRRVLAKYGKPVDVTYAEAARMMGVINQELASGRKTNAAIS